MNSNIKILMWAIGLFVVMAASGAGGYFSRSLTVAGDLAVKATRSELVAVAKDIRKEWKEDLKEVKDDIKSDLKEIRDDIKDLLRSTR